MGLNYFMFRGIQLLSGNLERPKLSKEIIEMHEQKILLTKVS